jgi:CheY-like chemotaxis protein
MDDSANPETGKQMTLPFSRFPAGQSPRQATDGADRSGGTDRPAMRVLVIEDNQDLAKLFCDLLEVMGCQTGVAFNAQSGLESAKRTMPDLIFCDLRLPGEKNGMDLAVELRANHAFDDVPLIAVTGYSDADEDRRALDAGFDKIFPKPIKFAQIQEVLNQYRNR